MVIDRSSLLNGLYEFSSEESGIVIGKPGIGKSYLLKQLKNKLIENGRLCFIIKIDNTFDFSHKAINNELGLKENWIETFKQIKIKDQKAVLIFDAFDAARDEKIRKGFLSQIRKAKRELADKWNVLVSVRTYDAFKSPELIQLFPDNKYNPERSYSRKFEIGELIEDEVLQVVSENQKFSDFYRNSNKELKQILHNPFFLEILDRIINDTTADEIEEIKKFKSESQLLKVYWDKKILSTQDSIAKELFLSSLTNLLVENRTLSYNKLSFFSSLTGNFGDIFSYFRSENIVDEISINNTRIAFSHNILFDYAVSIFCTNVDYDLFIAFIEADLTRPFFLRPSFLYFFTALWYEERKLFWDFYFKLFDNPKKEIQLFIRLVLNGIICSEYTSVEELNPLLTSINHEVSKPVIIRNILQSIRFIRTKSTSSDVALFGKISEFLNPEFLFDFAFLLDRSIPESGPEEAEIKVAGQTARNLLQYILNERNSNSKQFLDRIGSSRGIKLVAKTYYTDKVASRRLFEAVFLILNESSFEINYFTNLAEDVKYILNTDPEMVAEIYNKIFGYKETSDEQTQVGASVIMNFTSNRIQDFEMCYYRLQKYFPEFLAASPALAVKTGVLIVNQFINEDRANSNSETVFELDIAGRKLRFKTDYSSIWGDRTYGKPSETTVAIVKYFEELLTSGDFETLDSLVTIYLDNAISAFNWKLILGLFAKYPPAKSDEIFNYVASPFLMKHTDTSFEVRELLEKFSPYFNDRIRRLNNP